MYRLASVPSAFVSGPAYEKGGREVVEEDERDAEVRKQAREVPHVHRLVVSHRVSVIDGVLCNHHVRHPPTESPRVARQAARHV